MMKHHIHMRLTCTFTKNQTHSLVHCSIPFDLTLTLVLRYDFRQIPNFCFFIFFFLHHFLPFAWLARYVHISFMCVWFERTKTIKQKKSTKNMQIIEIWSSKYKRRNKKFSKFLEFVLVSLWSRPPCYHYYHYNMQFKRWWRQRRQSLLLNVFFLFWLDLLISLTICRFIAVMCMCYAYLIRSDNFSFQFFVCLGRICYIYGVLMWDGLVLSLIFLDRQKKQW